MPPPPLLEETGQAAASAASAVRDAHGTAVVSDADFAPDEPSAAAATEATAAAAAAAASAVASRVAALRTTTKVAWLHRDGGQGEDAGSGGAGGAADPAAVVVFGSANASAATLEALLVYLYTDSLEVAPHRIANLAALARDLGLGRLVALCALAQPHGGLRGLLAGRASISGGTSVERSKPLSGLSEPMSASMSESMSELTFESTFELDLAAAVGDKTFADVALVCRSSVASRQVGSPVGSQEVGSGEGEGAGDGGGPGDTVVETLWGHKAILGTVGYFATLLSGRFREAAKVGQPAGSAAGGGGGGGKCSGGSGRSETTVVEVDVSGLVSDGVSMAMLGAVVRYVYTGSAHLPGDPSALTGRPLQTPRLDRATSSVRPLPTANYVWVAG
jgi:hypothetical protein